MNDKQNSNFIVTKCFKNTISYCQREIHYIFLHNHNLPNNNKFLSQIKYNIINNTKLSTFI